MEGGETWGSPGAAPERSWLVRQAPKPRLTELGVQEGTSSGCWGQQARSDRDEGQRCPVRGQSEMRPGCSQSLAFKASEALSYRLLLFKGEDSRAVGVLKSFPASRSSMPWACGPSPCMQTPPPFQPSSPAPAKTGSAEPRALCQKETGKGVWLLWAVWAVGDCRESQSSVVSHSPQPPFCMKTAILLGFLPQSDEIGHICVQTHPCADLRQGSPAHRLLPTRPSHHF